jgi:hypothetical protein
MGAAPLALTVHWSPFDVRPAASAFADLQTAAAVTAGPLAFGRAPDNVSLSTAGRIYDKTVVSEVTTVDIQSSGAYTDTTDSAQTAVQAKADGTAVDTAPNGNGTANVTTADTTNAPANAGSISVTTVITYSDGSTQTSEAGLSGTFVTSGSGLARERLDSLVGDSLSESAVLAKLGVNVGGAAASAAQAAPSGTAISAQVSTAVNLTLTYIAQGDQRSVSGVETGTGSAAVAAFAPSDLSYSPSGAISTTRESMNFSAIINGGSLFTNSGQPWLAGTFDESTKAVTHVDGPNDITVVQDETNQAEFGVEPSSTLAESSSDVETSISFDALVNAGNGTFDNARFTLDQNAVQGSLSYEESGQTTARTWQQTSGIAVAVALTPAVGESYPQRFSALA